MLIDRGKMKATIAVAVILLLGSGGAVWELGRRVTTAEARTAELTQSFLAVERAMGYAGFIHHFKNAVLRPGEPGYIDLARDAYAATQAELAALERLLAQSGINVDISVLRETVEEYGRALGKIRAAHEEGLSIAEVDRWVRISDEGAALDLTSLEREIDALFRQHTELVSRWFALSLLMFPGLFSILILSVFFLVRQDQRQKMRQLEFDQSQAQLIREKAHSEELGGLIRELQRSNRDLDEFAYIASHDLKEPLRGIEINAKFLMREGLSGKAGERVRRMSELVARMERLIADLLFYSRLGRSGNKRVSVDPGAVIGSIRAELSEWLEERNGVIVETGEIPPLQAEPVKVKTVLQNLIVNGIKYNDDPAPRVELGFETSAVVNGQTLANAIVVKDNGIGIGEKYREKVFRIFSRLNKQGDYGTGTGSGLAFARRIVEETGGVIDFHSTPGEGTIFYVTLPLADARMGSGATTAGVSS